MSPSAAAKSVKPVSPTTAASNLFVDRHLGAATALGNRLAELIADPIAFASTLTEGFETLADPAYADGVRRVTPGLGPVLGVRLPLMAATYTAFKRGTRKSSPALLLNDMDRLLRMEFRELRWFGIWNLERLLPANPDGTWQLLRRAAAQADEWITVDTLAHPYAAGILGDCRRWPELEQLVYSPSRWERRLVGSTLATMAHVNVRGGHDPLVVGRGLTLIGQLIGDNQPDVQKALSWALRDFTAVDSAAVKAFLDDEALTARRTQDGNRAWVIKDAMAKLPDEAGRYRQILEGIRRKPGGPSTSIASATAAASGGGLAHATPEA
jgi:3-methyladenine DNA glycosylase AlkD